MYLTLLLLLSSAHSSIASPLSENPTADTSAKLARDVNVPIGKWLHERTNTVLTALGTFGPQGLMGSINTDGQAVPATSNGDDDNGDDNAYVAPSVCFGSGCAVAAAVYLAAIGLEATISFIKHLVSFHNNDSDWPMPTDESRLWSIRTFQTTDCGREGIRPGINPLASGSNGPYMMSNYSSTNFNYHDNKPCENFMFMDPTKIGNTQVRSAAVWLASSVENAYIFLYSDPFCTATVFNGATESAFTSDDSNLVAIYNGQGALFQGDDTDSIVEGGVWACLAGPWNAFSVVQVGTTDMTIPNDFYQNGAIPGGDTQPNERAPGQGANKYKHDEWAAYTWEQVGPAPPNTVPASDPNVLADGLTTGGD